MRRKNNIGTGDSTPPEAFPAILQDALYSDDYEMQVVEQQMVDKLIARAHQWDAHMIKVRRVFREVGGRVEYDDTGGIKFTLNGQEIYVSAEDYKTHFKPKRPIEERKLLLNIVRATLCEYDPARAIENLQLAAGRMKNIHLIRGTAKVADAAIAAAVTLDELARGQLIWEEDEDVPRKKEIDPVRDPNAKK